MDNNILIVGIIYLVIDGASMWKYVEQIKTMTKAKRVVGLARKYFVFTLPRELAAIWYGLVLYQFPLIILGILGFIFNLIILLLTIKYKKVPKEDWEWDDRVYNFIKMYLP
jgi:uncharacterized protein with PQ loop repeat